MICAAAGTAAGFASFFTAPFFGDFRGFAPPFVAAAGAAPRAVVRRGLAGAWTAIGRRLNRG